MIQSRALIMFGTVVLIFINGADGLFEERDERIFLQPGESRTITSPNFPNFTYKPGSSASKC